MKAAMRIKEQRDKLGLKQTELAELVGIHVQRMNNLENGQRDLQNIRVSLALKIARALKTTVEKLFG